MNVAGQDVACCWSDKDSIGVVQCRQVAVPIGDDLCLRRPTNGQRRDDALCGRGHDDQEVCSFSTERPGESDGLHRRNAARDAQYDASVLERGTSGFHVRVAQGHGSATLQTVKTPSLLNTSENK